MRVVKIHDLRSGDVAAGDGRTILVDRLWPRGVAKDSVDLDDWFKEVAPSPDLRKWFGHDPDRFDEFADRYRHELDERAAAINRPDSATGDRSSDDDDSETDELAELLAAAADATVAKPLYLAYAAKDRDHNHALVLAAWLRNEID
ncbi:hypothetical protein HMPREF1650_05735 [Corynebacterium freneyi DNF00450]|uniref:Uroporphyrin-III methyltransferase n=1 Tax=Corynebacterium freneyi DNF00450 TaxID=1287475 RepID=A0A095ZEU4_9CORY|nr:hypothetical protein HMPREF1650_04995 [Corynebacterium freneyi DNF00450]KGF17182.1 hypothetical protein HMPREF1650_05735 [Corynebacterium freneyi DNF00450]